MASLMILRVIYSGENYEYISPELKPGLNIIEGKNGSGKTTFSDLISYGLGIYVREYDRTESETHTEICGDKDNFVMLEISINDSKYVLKRFFNNNTIFVTDSNGNVESYAIYRGEANPVIFSDWLLSKLQIEVVEIYQGSRKFKINFPDLYRLIHYDQDSVPRKIYKEHRTDNNFIADSVQIRKVIFELLIGHQFSEYHSLVGELNKLERERDTAKSVFSNYEKMVGDMGYDISQLTTEAIEKELMSANIKLDKLQIYRESRKKLKVDSRQFNHQLTQLRTDLVRIEREYAKFQQKKETVLTEHSSLLDLKEDLIREVTHLKKIISSHEELNLFSPNTCPCCLQRVERKENHCICGSEIDESQYEKFFYSSEEYLDILKSKQKSVDTIDVAIESCEEELNDIDKTIIILEIQKEKLTSHLDDIEKDVSVLSNDSELNQINDEILQEKSKIQDLEQENVVLIKYDSLEELFNTKNEEYGEKFRRVRILEGVLRAIIEKKVNQFNEIYNSLMTDATDDINKAIIDENYMPIINDGEYKQASTNVPKRFMYFLTLLRMSIETDIPFPRFLLIDTPENLGIDNENLDRVLQKIIPDPEVEVKHDFQVILTTGINKYPPTFKEFVRDTLTDDNKLLKSRSKK
jgi:DNA repair exonuclease SbcCD ATPase subunit